MELDAAILGQVALGYSPVIDEKRGIMATRLTMFPVRPDVPLDVNELLALVESIWPHHDRQVVLNIASETLLTELIHAEPSRNCLIEIPSFLAADPAHVPAFLKLHQQGTQLLLKGRPPSALPPEILPCFRYAVVDLSDERRLTPNGSEHSMRQILTIQSGVHTVEALNAAFDRGVYAVLGWPIDDLLDSGRETARKASGDMAVMVQLVQQLDRGEDLEVLEATVKRDPTLAFQLLRYINSPAFGLPVEVTSFSHAIMLLGYSRLKRWVCLLLATASRDVNMRPVMFAAVRRGFMMEAMGRSQGDEDRASEMFICGVFSLLDKIFHQPFSELLSNIPMPEAVQAALAKEEGPLRPYLELVMAMEQESLYDIKDSAERTMMTMVDINKALISALSLAAAVEQ